MVPPFICLFLLVLGMTACSNNESTAPITTQVPGEGDVPVQPAIFPDISTGVQVPAEEDTSAFWDGCKAEGEPGCACTENSECLSGFCVQTSEGKQCTDTCVENCPQGWTCAQVNSIGSDITYICLPKHTNLCKPCETGADCAQLGGTAGYCLSAGEGVGSFCSAPCSDSAPCPDGYQCQTFEGVAGTPTSQCWPEDNICDCSELAIQEGATTSCSIANEFGTCAGERQCLSEGLSDCSASPATFEICDQLDNDCDGYVDEGFQDMDGDGMIDCPDPSDGWILRGYLMGDGAGLTSDGEARLLHQSIGVTRFLSTSTGGETQVEPTMTSP